MKRIILAILSVIILTSAIVYAQPVQSQSAQAGSTVPVAVAATPALVPASMIEVVFVPGGSFLREGSEISISSFFIGRYEVTQAQYQELMGKNPSRLKDDPRLPVEQVSWYEAVACCNALSAKEGLEPVYTINGTDVAADFSRNGWRLPTEAEWEFAARGGNASKGYTYAGSNDIDAVAWFVDNAVSKTFPVGNKNPNELGLYDMSGNVFEWCNDWYGEYEKGLQTDPRGADSGFLRVLRGGSGYRHVGACAVANRTFAAPDHTRFGAGLRMVRSGY